MKPVLTVFFDGLKADSLPQMPFLNSLPYKRRLQTILGYSIACHASMYSGVYPNKHHLWFVWQCEPETSPFKWLHSARFLAYADSLPTRFLLHKLTTRFVRRTAYWGIPRIVNLPIRYWHNIDVSEKKYWEEPGYLAGYPTIFEILRANKIAYETVGMSNGAFQSAKQVGEYQFTGIKPWTYLFIGDTDALSHKYVQESPEAIEKLKEFDRLVEHRYLEFQERVGDFDFFVFSDHGHIQVNEKINIYSLFREAGDDLNRYMHLLDANFARLWPRGDLDRKKILKVLSQINNGFVLTESDLAKYHVDMPDNRFGEMIFYLDAGSAFTWTTFGYGKKQNSMHGYLPSHPECDGVFASNHAIAGDGPVRLVDILPSLLSLLDLPAPSHVEGRAIWR